MKSKVKMTYEVAKWEFGRWFKIKDQIFTILFGALISLLIFGGKAFLEKLGKSEINISVINTPGIEIKLDEGSYIKLSPKRRDELDTQKKLLNEKEIDALLVIDNIEQIELFVNKEPVWLTEIQKAINNTRQQKKIKEANISGEVLQDIFKPAVIKTTFMQGAKESNTTGEKIAAGIFIGLMLLGVFLGLAYQFVAITGEKQLRITEVIVSAIKPQMWIDGKIIGITLLSLILLITYSISSVIFVVISSLFGSGWSLPISISNPSLIILLLFISLTGFLFWNTFFSAIAATINDPNSSARGSLIMLPVLPAAMAFFAFSNPDSLVMKILTIFPLTSAPVLSVRLVLTEVAFIEVFLSIAILILTTWYIRKAAGKIFAISILMYGKEPSWKEISKWIKEKQ